MAFIRDKSDEEKREILRNIIDLLESGKSLTEIGKIYSTSRQSVEQFLARNYYDITKTIKNNRCVKSLLMIKDKSSVLNYKEKVQKEYADYINKLKEKNALLRSKIQYLTNKIERLEKEKEMENGKKIRR